MQNALATVIPLDSVRRGPQPTLRALSPEIRVVVADGHALVRAGFRVLLESPERIAVVAEATTG